MTLFEELQRRGLLAQLTDEEEIKNLINAGKATVTITGKGNYSGTFPAAVLSWKGRTSGR